LSTVSATRPVDTGLWGRLPLAWKIGLLPALFVLVLVLLQLFTWNSTRQLNGDAQLVDLTGRQRVLNERALWQALATAEGDKADWQGTIATFYSSADSLINGGETVVNLDTGERGVIRRVPPAIAAQLSEGKQKMELLADSMDAYLRLPVNSPARPERLRLLLRESREISLLANRATKALNSYSIQKLEQTVAQQQAMALIAAIAGVVISILLTRQITAPLGGVMARAQEIGEGDLRGRPLAVRATDEIGRLGGAFNAMQEGLRSVASQARSAAESLSAAAAEILASAQEQAAGTGEQAAAVQQTTTTMEQISRSGVQIAERARQVATTAEATSAASEAGLAAVHDATESMDSIREQTEAVARNVVMLSEKTRAIEDIIETVNEIAEQSHLLALNAAIEAVGAGDQGRRFGVVADEMKHLADQSRDATVQVRSILGEIQKQIHTSVLLTEEAVKRIEHGRRQSDTAETTIRQMAVSIVDSVNAFQQIVAAANQQQIGFEQVTQAAQQIRAAVDQATVGTRQLEAAALDVNALSQQLRTAMESYRL